MESTNKYILQWRDSMLNAAKALEDKNFEEYENLLSQADQAYELYKQDSALTYECTNFGMSNHIIENALPFLFKKNPKILKEVMKVIKEDKNLNTQFKFFNALSKCSKNIDIVSFIKESLELVKADLNLKTLNESNKKLADLIIKYEIKPSQVLSENELKFYESCDFLFKNKRKLSNLNIINENLNFVSNYASSYIIKEVNDNVNDVFALIEKYEKQYKNVLSEEEKKFVQTLMDCKSSHAIERKEKLFKTLKEDCLTIIAQLQENASEEDLEGLKAIEEQINSQVFCETTLTNDVARLLEIRDVLKS
jgi:hypothetical protein